MCIIASEKDKLLSETVHKENRIQDLLEEIGKTKDDLGTIQLNYESTDKELQEFKNLHLEFQQKYDKVLEENKRLNQEIENLSEEAQKFGSSLEVLQSEVGTRSNQDKYLHTVFNMLYISCITCISAIFVFMTE